MHPLGFVYTPLARWDHATLRLHIWPPARARRSLIPAEVSPMHDHTWNLHSYVVCGRLDNVEIELAEERDPTAADHRLFTIQGEGALDRVKPTDVLVRILREITTSHGAGDVYSMPAHVIHRTEAHGDPTATLVLADRTERRMERALGALELRAYSTRRLPYRREDFVESVRGVLDIVRTG